MHIPRVLSHSFTDPPREPTPEWAPCAECGNAIPTRRASREFHAKTCRWFFAKPERIHPPITPSRAFMRVGRVSKAESAKLHALLRGERDEISDLSRIGCSTPALDRNDEERVEDARDSGYFEVE